jgi:serine/threonine protein phosphatase PrpC
LSFIVTVAAQSDTGCVRKNNQDRYGYDVSRELYAVCDGMGGMSGGEVASELAIRSLLSTDGPAAEVNSLPKDVLLFNLVLAANRAVRQMSLENPLLEGMGTTLVAACVDAERLLIANVGDSRAYLIRDGGCAQLTKDHSFIEEQISLGMMTREMALHSPDASVITRAVGVDEEVEPDLFLAGVGR